jgi:predicted helicase
LGVVTNRDAWAYGASTRIVAEQMKRRLASYNAERARFEFLRILSTAMEIAAGFGDGIIDDEDEDSFRESLGPKVRVIDAPALRAGHWT